MVTATGASMKEDGALEFEVTRPKAGRIAENGGHVKQQAPSDWLERLAIQPRRECLDRLDFVLV